MHRHFTQNLILILPSSPHIPPTPCQLSCSACRESSCSRTNMLVRISITQKQRSHKHSLTCLAPNLFILFFVFINYLCFFFLRQPPKAFSKLSWCFHHKGRKVLGCKNFESLCGVVSFRVVINVLFFFVTWIVSTQVSYNFLGETLQHMKMHYTCLCDIV